MQEALRSAYTYLRHVAARKSYQVPMELITPTNGFEKIDFLSLQREVLNAIRGQNTSKQLSSELGYSFDQVARWERGQTRLKWSDFYKICNLKAIHLQQIFFEVYSFWSDELDNPKEFVRQVLLFVAGPVSQKEIAHRLRFTQDRIERWLYGRSELTFIELCQILEAFSLQTFYAWLDRLVGSESLPSIQHLAFKNRNEQSVHYAFPYASAVEGALLMKDYIEAPTHSLEIIERLTTLPKEMIQGLLQILVAAGRIRWTGQKYSIDQTIVNAQGGTRIELSRLVRYWTKRALLRFETSDGLPVTKRNNPNAVLFRVAPLSKEATRAVTEALLKCHNEISAIVDNDSGPKEELRIIVGHYFSMDETPESVSWNE